MPRRRGPRRDALPEGREYRDDGCEVSGSCLSCPLPRCRFEEPVVPPDVALRRARIATPPLCRESADALARRFGVSTRTIYRDMQWLGVPR